MPLCECVFMYLYLPAGLAVCFGCEQHPSPVHHPVGLSLHPKQKKNRKRACNTCSVVTFCWRCSRQRAHLHRRRWTKWCLHARAPCLTGWGPAGSGATLSPSPMRACPDSAAKATRFASCTHHMHALVFAASRSQLSFICLSSLLLTLMVCCL